MARKRDYKAEYARRQQLARARGFSGYSEKRRKIERGLTPAINPKRLRSGKTIFAQQKFAKESQYETITRLMSTGQETSYLREMKIQDSIAWYETYGRNIALEFDENKARKSDKYLDSYYWGFVAEYGDAWSSHRLHHTDAMETWMVEEAEIYDQDEYDERYKGEE